MPVKESLKVGKYHPRSSKFCYLRFREGERQRDRDIERKRQRNQKMERKKDRDSESVK